MSKVKSKLQSLLSVLLCVCMLFGSLSPKLVTAAGSTDQTSKKMIYLNSVTTQAGKVFGILAKNLEKNTQYTISFQCKVEEGKFENKDTDTVFLRVRKDKVRSGTTLYEGHVTPGTGKGFNSYELDADGYTRRYTFTTDGTSTDYGINFEFNKAMKMYLADFKVYKTADAAKTNVLPVDGTSDVLITNVDTKRTPGEFGWDADYPTLAKYNEAKTEMTFGNSSSTFYTATLKDYDSTTVFVTAQKEEPKMLYVNSVTTQSGKVLGMLAKNLETNTKYTISFKCKVEEGKFENKDTDTVYLRVRKDKVRGGSTMYEGHVAPGTGKGFNSYELDADGYTRRYTFTTDATSTDYGINFEFNKAMKMYLADFKVYKTDDTTQTSVLPISADPNALITNVDTKRTPGEFGWDGDYPTLAKYNEAKTEMTYGNSSGTFYTITLKDYDAENVFVPATPEEEPKMIYVNSVTTQSGKVLGMLAKNLETNTKYTISFKCKVEEGKFENKDTDTVYLRVRKDKVRGGSTMYEGHVAPGTGKGFNSYELDADGYTRRYTFTTDATSTDYGINFEFNKAMKMYLADFKVYKTDDTTQTSVLPISADPNALITNVDTKRTPGEFGWDGDYPTLAKYNEAKTEMTYGNSSGTFYTITLKDYDAENVFVPVTPVEEPKMLYIDSVSTQAGKVLAMLAQNLEKSTKYTISFKCKVAEGKFANDDTDDVYMRVRKDKVNGGTTLYESNAVKGTTKGFKNYELDADGYTRRYTFTTNDTSTDYAISFEFNRAMKMYIADFKVYKTDDAEKTNVMPISGNSNVLITNVDTKRTAGAFGWDADWPTLAKYNDAKTEMTFGNASGTFYTVTLLPYDEESIFVPGQGEVGPEPGPEPLPAGKKMIELEVNKEGANQIFAQNVTLEKGKKYTLSFQYAFEEGVMNTTTFVQVKAKLGSNKYTTYRSSHETGEKGFESVTYDKATGKATYTFTHKEETGEYGIGFTSVKPFKMYLADVKLFDVTDKAKNILASDGNEEKSLQGWRSDWREAGENEEFVLKTSEGVILYTATMQMYDADVFKPGIEIGPKMIYLETTKDGKGQIFGQNVNLEKGKTYTISFQSKFVEGGINTSTYVRVKAALGSGKYTTYHSTHFDGEKGFTVTEDEATCTTYCTFTHTQPTGQYAIGFETLKQAKIYLGNVKLYEASDKAKKNLLPAKEFEQYSLNGWRSDYVLAGDVQKFELKDKKGVLFYRATLQKYDKKTFEPKKIDPTMIYVVADKNGKDQVFGQNIKLEKGKNYTISFRYKFEEGDMDSSVFFRVKDGLKTGKYKSYHSSNSTGDKGFELQYNKKTCEAKYSFTHTGENGTYAVGFQFSGATKFYITDFKAYETTDPEQKNLLPSRRNEDTLIGWGSDWASAEAEKTFQPKKKDGTVLYTANVMPLDESIFQPDPKLPNKMVYIENNGTYRQLVQRVKVKPGKTYRFSFGVASPIAAQGMVMHKGERVVIFNNMKPINDPDYKKDYYEVVFEFTLPETFGGEPVDTSNVFVGIQFPAGTIAYVFDPKLWDITDSEQDNLYVNPGFNKGLDNWCFSWGAWFIPGLQGMGLTEFEKENEFKLQVMEYDEQKFITYYDDSRFNDGEWWSPDDIVKDKPGRAIVEGDFKTTDGSPISDAKMVLKSVRGSMECETDKDGKFKFEKLQAGFYELYYTDTEGTLVKTSFAQNIKEGYTVKVNVFAEGVTKGLTPLALFLIADGVVAAGVAGTVFTLRFRKRKLGLKKTESE